MSTIEVMATNLGDRVPLELSPTGFAYFPRHCEDDDEWERVSQHSTSKPEQTQEEERKPNPKKRLFKGWFGIR